MKKFSKGSPIQDEHFSEARELWATWNIYRQDRSNHPKPTDNSWIVSVEEIKQRGYDLAARNPNRAEAESLPHPTELTARLLENTRELHSIIENLHEILNNGNNGSKI